MSIILAYPTVAAPTASVTLPDVENMPSSRGRRVFQTSYDTDSGIQLIYDWGSQLRTIVLDLFPLTEIQKNDVEKFYYQPVGSGGVGGMVAKWQLQDSLNILYDVRFAMDTIEPIMRNVGLYSVNLIMREAP